jgi:uncharacterized protein YbjT (DUF2867 family)
MCPAGRNVVVTGGAGTLGRQVVAALEESTGLTVRIAVALAPPVGDAPEIAGPEVLSLGEIAETWLDVTHHPRTLVPVSLEAVVEPARAHPAAEGWARSVLEAYRAAWNTPQGPRTLGKTRFADWLRARQSPADQKR